MQSLFKPINPFYFEAQGNQEDLIQEILDDVILTCSGLIMDIENGKIEASVLKNEIAKKVQGHKGVFQPEVLKMQIYSMIYGYGLLEAYVEDATYTDIDMPRFNFALGKRFGKIERLPVKFASELDFERFCKLLVIRNGGVINAVDNHCRVSDKVNKLRINVCISPRNATGPSLNIRKHRQEALGLEELKDLSFLDEALLNQIYDLNASRKNFVICGKGASGKTTLLRAIINASPVEERTLICESDTEIYPEHPNSIVQHIVKSRNEKHQVTLEGLIREGLTMSLDTYCIGEITGAEAWPFIKAGHTDHRVMATIHASSAHDALERLYMLVENETRMSECHLKKMIAHTVQIIFYIRNFKVCEVIEIIGYDPKKESYIINRLYQLREEVTP